MENPIALIGQTNFRNQHIRFGIKQRDRLAHMLLVGKTGAGKSTVLANMMRSDLENGTGFALLDAHGDLAEQILALVPQHRLKDTVYINPSMTQFSPAVNLLMDATPHLAVSQFLSTFQHLWPEFWGPRSEYLLRNALLLLTQTFPAAMLSDITNVLTDFGFRISLVNRLPQGNLKRFWENEFDQYSKHFRTEAIAPILNKIGAVTLNPTLRPLLCQRRNDVDFRALLNSNGILIVNLAKGSVGEDGSALLGSILLSKLVLTAMSRSAIHESKRAFFGIYADEAQAFITESTISLFSELRKFGIGATWATQYLSSFPETLRDAILGNVGTLLSFAVSGEDAEFLAREFMPHVTTADLVGAPTHNFYLKLRIDGITSHPFSALTIPMRVLGVEHRPIGIRTFATTHDVSPLQKDSHDDENSEKAATLF